ncbi:Multidrug MFS transporter [Balamuthia mandrillaris]
MWSSLFFYVLLPLALLAGAYFKWFRRYSSKSKDRTTNAGRGRSKVPPLTVTECEAGQLPEELRRQVWRLFKQNFVNEHKNFQSFDEYLRSRLILLFRDTTPQRGVQGFILLSVTDHMIEGWKVGVIMGDFFALNGEYRGSSVPIFALLKFCVKTKLRHPFKLMYYFFVTYSYKSYLSFSRSMGEFYPRHSVRTPAWENKVLKYLGTLSAGDWGRYNPERYVIEDCDPGRQGQLSDLARSRPRDLSTTCVWFSKQNPNFAKGDCLCVLCCVGLKNILAGAKNSLIRALGLASKKRRRMQQTKAKIQLDKTSRAPVAFGIRETREEFLAKRVETQQPFRVQVDEEELSDLFDHRLERARFPDQLEMQDEEQEGAENKNEEEEEEEKRQAANKRKKSEAQDESNEKKTLDKWRYGSELGYMKELVEYWLNDYDWTKHEALLNKYPQYTMEINGKRIHYLHIKSKEKKALPLVLVHGWPGSYFEFFKVIDMLVDPVNHGANAEQAFHVIIPSIPGYGWSEAPKEPGYDVKAAAKDFTELMEALGYKHYVAQGGDWGHLICAYMALVDPHHCLGIHINMVAFWEPQDFWTKAMITFDVILQRWRLSPEERKWFAFVEEFTETELGYMSLQRTKPQTIGYSLTDSPVGLAAWIIEKFRTWSDCDGDLESRFSKDELLTNIMIYWLSKSGASSARLYYETAKRGRLAPPQFKVWTPTAVAIYPKEILRPPRRWAQHFYNVKRWTVMRSGGHFAAWEEPESLVKDLRAFFYDDLRLHQMDLSGDFGFW